MTLTDRKLAVALAAKVMVSKFADYGQDIAEAIGLTMEETTEAVHEAAKLIESAATHADEYFGIAHNKEEE